MTRLGVPQPSSSIGPMTKPPLLTGKDRAQRVDDLRRVGDRVLREQHGVELSRARALRQRRRARRVLHADQAADAGQREAERELDRRELPEDQEQQREARLRVRVEQRDRLDADREHLELEHRPHSRSRRDREVAAALDDAGVEREADAVRRLEREVERMPALTTSSVEQDAQAIDRSPRTGRARRRRTQRARPADARSCRRSDPARG